ncbi:MAG: radical SAM protein [Pseudomonadota bacterium]
MNRPYLDAKIENETRLLAEIRAGNPRPTAFPPRCTFEISWRCNYTCKKCTYSKLTRGENFSAIDYPEWQWEDIERIAHEYFPTCRLTQSTLLGEPFLSPHFKDLMNLYRRFGVYYRSTTNGSLLTEEKLDSVNGVVDWLKCSFDGHTAELYEKLHLNGNFSTVVRNLKRFSDNRRYMTPFPWFRIGMVLMRSNMNYLKDYADFVFQEIGVDEMEVMALNYANDQMLDEFHWDLADELNTRLDELVDHCIDRKYRLRLPFTRMPRADGSWNGPTAGRRADEIAGAQPDADNSGYDKYSEEVRVGDIFGNKQTLEKGYVWSNEMRISRIKGDDGNWIGVCPALNRPFFKPPTIESDGKDWIKVESCGSCSTYVFGNLKEQSFSEIYGSPMYQQVRTFLYGRYNHPRENWMIPCRHCLCVDPVYSYESNGVPNVGLRFFPGADLYRPPVVSGDRTGLLRKTWNHWREHGLVSTGRAAVRFMADRLGHSS